MKTTDHGHLVTINSKLLDFVVEALGGLLMKSHYTVDFSDRRSTFEKVPAILEALGWNEDEIDKLRHSYLDRPMVSGGGIRVFEVTSELRDWTFRGVIEGQFSPIDNDLLPSLTSGLAVAGFRIREVTFKEPSQ